MTRCHEPVPQACMARRPTASGNSLEISPRRWPRTGPLQPRQRRVQRRRVVGQLVHRRQSRPRRPATPRCPAGRSRRPLTLPPLRDLAEPPDSLGNRVHSGQQMNHCCCHLANSVGRLIDSYHSGRAPLKFFASVHARPRPFTKRLPVSTPHDYPEAVGPGRPPRGARGDQVEHRGSPSGTTAAPTREPIMTVTPSRSCRPSSCSETTSAASSALLIPRPGCPSFRHRRPVRRHHLDRRDLLRRRSRGPRGGT